MWHSLEPKINESLSGSLKCPVELCNPMGCPAFIDSTIHLESEDSLLLKENYKQFNVHGTDTTVSPISTSNMAVPTNFDFTLPMPPQNQITTVSRGSPLNLSKNTPKKHKP